MSANVFVGDHVLLDVGFAGAKCQLERLAGDGVLLSAAEYAYSAGITGLAEAAGVVGELPRLAGVWAGELAETAGCARLALRWEAIGADNALFPALDGDLTLTPAGEKITLIALAGVFRLRNRGDTGLDPSLMRCFADTTVRSFVARLACALMHPAGAGAPARRARHGSPPHPPG